MSRLKDKDGEMTRSQKSNKRFQPKKRKKVLIAWAKEGWTDYFRYGIVDTGCGYVFNTRKKDDYAPTKKVRITIEEL